MDTLLRRPAHKSERVVKPRILRKNLNGEAVEIFLARLTERGTTEVENITHNDEDRLWNNQTHTICGQTISGRDCWDYKSKHSR